jgi:plastocyanin
MRKAASFLAVVISLSACQGRADPLIGIISDTTATDTTGRSNLPLLSSVLIVDNEYQPPLSLIRTGGAVVWTWGAGVTGQHNVTFDDPNRTSPTQTQGTHTVTFPDTGTFNYHCTIHITMTGTVLVR